MAFLERLDGFVPSLLILNKVTVKTLLGQLMRESSSWFAGGGGGGEVSDPGEGSEVAVFLAF